MGSNETKPDLHGLVSDLLAEVRDLRRQVTVVDHKLDALGLRVSDGAPATPPGGEALVRLYDTKSLADRWGVSERTVENEVAAGALVPTFIRGARRFTPEAVKAYERSNSGLRRRRRTARRRAAPKGASPPDRPVPDGSCGDGAADGP